MHRSARDILYVCILLAIAVGLIWVMSQFAGMVDKPATGDLATWFGGVGAFTAAVVALYLASSQNRIADERAKNDVLTRDGALLLALHNMVKDVRQITTLAGFQLDDSSNPVLYPDIARELEVVRALMTQLPLDRLAVHGQIPTVLHVGRIASELAMMLTPQPKADGSFYRNNRMKLHDLMAQASGESIALSEYIKALDIDLYEKHKDSLTKL
jgi:hypothetical protein